MPTVKIPTLKIGREYRAVILDKVDEADQPNVKTFVFDCRDITAQDVIDAGAAVNKAGLLSREGGGDADAVMICKGIAYAKIIKSWTRPDTGDADMPVNDANIRTLPRSVLREIGFYGVNGLPDEDEFTKAKN